MAKTTAKKKTAKKSSAKKGDEHYYEFTRDGFKIRLTQFSPTDLKLDCVFRGISLDSVNQWNFTTRVGRALREILAWLWETVAEPVLEALGHKETPVDGWPWPRVWWVPIGAML